MSTRNLMLVDSNLERCTLDQLMHLRYWLAPKHGIRICEESDESGASPMAPRESSIPEFILRAERVPASGSATVIVETMGYSDKIYRSRKEEMHELMAQAVAGAPIVRHDFHFSEAQTQDACDRRFWLEAPSTITGPGDAGARGIAGDRSPRCKGFRREDPPRCHPGLLRRRYLRLTARSPAAQRTDERRQEP